MSASVRNLAARHLPGELAAGRSHFPHNVRGDRYAICAMPEADINLESMVERFAVRMFRPFEYCDECFNLMKGGC
ncbi:MAG TPA: hypothetical protein DCG57_10525 [Candidatus Riflebacteria bacterium]|jgi:hypothetical protein|nr:hypothetical protein [Candidatus Riflebacteria bacterium]